VSDTSTPRKLRVVYLDHVARLSGGEIALLRTLPALLDRVDPLVILGEDGPLVERLRAEGIPVEILPIDAALRDVRKDTVAPGGLDPRTAPQLLMYVLRLTRRLRQLRPDLVHTNSLKAALYGGAAGRLAGVPVVWHIRDRIAEDYLPTAAVRLVHGLSRVLPTAIVANSRSTLATLPRRTRGTVLSNPVVPDSVTPPEERAGRHEGGLTVGVVGRLAPWKGQHVFLRAFADALGGTPANARLVGSAMFGEDAYEASLHELVDELGLEAQVEFRGFREDVWAELEELDVLVHCSTSPEPFGQVVLEGLAAGLPVIASAEGGPAEVVTDGRDGLLVPPRDAQALAKALTRLAGDAELRVRLGHAGRQTSQAYSPQRTAERLVEVYERVQAPVIRGEGAL